MKLARSGPPVGYNCGWRRDKREGGRQVTACLLGSCLHTFGTLFLLESMLNIILITSLQAVWACGWGVRLHLSPLAPSSQGQPPKGWSLDAPSPPG